MILRCASTLIARRALSTFKAIFTTAPRFSVAPHAFLGNCIRHSLSVGFLASVGFVAMFIIFTLTLPIVIFRLSRRTVYQVSVVGPEVPTAAMVAMLGNGRGGLVVVR